LPLVKMGAATEERLRRTIAALEEK
jgi:hypothetical protein